MYKKAIKIILTEIARWNLSVRLLEPQFLVASFVLALYLTLLFLFALNEIHIFRHDALSYISSYEGKLRSEGRWINYLLFPFLSSISGKAAGFLCLIFFFVFSAITAYRGSKIATYSVLLALLIIQVPPLTGQLLWPATVLPAFFILFMAALSAPVLAIYSFYIIFGILFFGTMSNMYYLLPLLHLGLLTNESTKENLNVFLTKVILPWALGFVAGYFVALAMVYFLSGQFGISIAEWRRPAYIENFSDLIRNLTTASGSLFRHISSFFSSTLVVAAVTIPLLMGLATSLRRYLWILAVSLSIIVVHYVIVLPYGIYISFRTVISVYVGIVLIACCQPFITKKHSVVTLASIVFILFSFNNTNRDALAWYANLTNTHYEELLRVTPLPPYLYKGVMFIGSKEDLTEINHKIHPYPDVKGRDIAPLNFIERLYPIAREAGFRTVLMCDSMQSTECKRKLNGGAELPPFQNDRVISFYDVVGEKNGLLVISLRNEKHK